MSREASPEAVLGTCARAAREELPSRAPAVPLQARDESEALRLPVPGLPLPAPRGRRPVRAPGALRGSDPASNSEGRLT